MTILRSLYSTEVSALVPNDLLPPSPPDLTGITQDGQQDDAVTHGRSLITVNWTAPTTNEFVGGEFLGVADGNAQQFETTYDPIVTHTIFEMAGAGGGGFGDTTLTAPANPKDKSLTVASVANFAIGDWVQVDDTVNREYAQIADIQGLVLVLENRLICCNVVFPSGSTTVKEVNTVTTKTITTDYTIALATGIVDILAGQFTASSDIVMRYNTSLQDLAGYILLRNPVLLANDDHATVIADLDTVIVDNAIGSGLTTFQETLTAAENGETWYYYLYSFDDETPANISEIVSPGPLQIEMLPSIPQNLGKQVSEDSVVLSWNSIGPGSSDGNTNGYNVYRNSGLALDQGNLLQLNAILIPVGQLVFEDNADGVTAGDRVPNGTVALPQNGQTFTYVLESEDTVSTWDSGTQNQKSGQGAVTIAQKTP